MSNYFDVQVLNSEGDPVEGAGVDVLVRGLVTGGEMSEYTDTDGHAEFETAGDYEDSREIVITVRGQRFGPFEIGGGAFTVTLD